MISDHTKFGLLIGFVPNFDFRAVLRSCPPTRVDLWDKFVVFFWESEHGPMSVSVSWSVGHNDSNWNWDRMKRIATLRNEGLQPINHDRALVDEALQRALDVA